MIKPGESGSKVEIISRGTLDQPALVRIAQQDYVAFEHDPNTILVLEEVARELLTKDIPPGIALTPCKRAQFLEDLEIGLDIPITPSRFEGIAPFRIYHLGNGRAEIVIGWHCTKGFWKNDSGYHWKLQRARVAVLGRRRSLPGLRFHRFVDQGYLAGVEFAVTIRALSVESAINSASEMSELIHLIIEDSIRDPSQDGRSEAAFVRDTFIPLLKSLGFRNVVFHHGSREFGKDVLFSRQTEFGMTEYWAAQVKLGNVSGRANSYLDLIVNQAHEAFKIPLLDIQTKSKFRISKFVVAITGRFTENAVEKICEKIETHSQRNNIIFLDGEKLQELIKSSSPKGRAGRPGFSGRIRRNDLQ